MSNLTPPRVPFAESATALQDDERLAFDADAGQLKLPRIKFPDGTTQKRGARGPSKSIDDFGAYAAGIFQTTGTIANGSNILKVAHLTSFIVGTYVAVQGAGENPGDWLSAKITAIDEASGNLTLDAMAKHDVRDVVTHQDNSPAIQAAIDSFTPADGFAGMLWIPSGIYWCNSTIRMRRRGLRVIGESRESTELYFPGGVKGFVFVSAYSPDPDGGAGDNSVLSNVFIAAIGGAAWAKHLRLGGDYGYCVNPPTPTGLCYIVTATRDDGFTGTDQPIWPVTEGTLVPDNQVTWISVAAHGITMYTVATIDSVREYGFGGDGIAIYGDASGHPRPNGDPLHGPPSNADLWEVRRSWFYNNQGFGLHVAGGTVNAGNAFSVSCENNNFYGVYDNSDLGNTYTGCHTANNSLGSYKAVSVNGPSLFLNCYAEHPQTALITGSSMFISGLLTLDPANQAAYIGNGLYINGTEFLNGQSKRGRRLGVANSVVTQFLSFVMDDTNDSIEAQEEAPFMSSRDTLSFYNTNGTLIALPFGRSALRTLGLLVNQALQIGRLNFPNIRTHVDLSTLTDKRRWLRGWECRNSSPTSAADAYSTICTRSGRGVPVWQPGHLYKVSVIWFTPSATTASASTISISRASAPAHRMQCASLIGR